MLFVLFSFGLVHEADCLDSPYPVLSPSLSLPLSSSHAEDLVGRPLLGAPLSRLQGPGQLHEPARGNDKDTLKAHLFAEAPACAEKSNEETNQPISEKEADTQTKRHRHPMF